MIQSVWIIGRSGGLAFHQDFAAAPSPSPPAGNASNAPASSASSTLSRLAANDYLVIASTFQSVHALSCQLAPTESTDQTRHSSGIQQVTYGPSNGHSIHCLQSPTGVKFLAIASSSTAASVQAVLRRVWEVYAEWVCWNPFQVHQAEMPIRGNAGFEAQLAKVVGQHNQSVKST